MRDALLELKEKALDTVARGETERAPLLEGSPGTGTENRWQRFDVVRYRYNGHTHSGTVIRTMGSRVWVKTGAATVAIADRDIVSLTRPSPAR